MINILYFPSSGGELRIYQAYGSLPNWMEYGVHPCYVFQTHWEECPTLSQSEVLPALLTHYLLRKILSYYMLQNWGV